MSGEFENSAKIEQRAVIKYLVKKGLNATEIKNDMQEVLGESAPSYRVIAFWSSQFKRGRESIEDDPRPGRPVSCTTDQNVKKVEDLILRDRRIKLWQIATEMGISKERVGNIVHDVLGMSKVSARWVPKMLSAFDKQRRVQTSSEFLEMCKGNEEKIINRVVTGDETWIRYYDPESKRESMQWIYSGETAPRKFKTQASAGKIMATIFWDCEGILLIDYLPPKTTMTGQYYANLMAKLRNAIKEKRRGKLRNGVLLLHDNAPAHTSKLAKLAIRDSGFEEIDHPPYSPDMAPSDYYLFPKLKKHLRGTKFLDDEMLKMATEVYFAEQEKEFFYKGLYLLLKRCNKCIEVEGDYIEK